MQGMLFNAAQNYAWILEFSKKLLAHEPNDENANKTEHQINTRIFNNAFCGLLRLGYPYTISNENSVSYLVFTIEGTEYKCPVTTASNVLREEFEQYVPDAVSLIPPKSKNKKSKKLDVAEQNTREAVAVDVKETELLNQPDDKTSDMTPKHTTVSQNSQPEKKKAVAAEQLINTEHTEIKNEKNTQVQTQEETVTPQKKAEKIIKHDEKPQQIQKEKKPQANIPDILMNAGFPNLDDLSFAFSKGSDKVQSVGVESKQVEAATSERLEQNSDPTTFIPKNDRKEIQKVQETRKNEEDEVTVENQDSETATLPQMETDFMLPPDDESEEEMPTLHVAVPATHTETKIDSEDVHSGIEKVHEDIEDDQPPLPVPQSGHFFKPKNQPVIQPENTEEISEVSEEDLSDTKAKEEKRGLFSFFKKDKGGKREGEVEKDTVSPMDPTEKTPVVPVESKISTESSVTMPEIPVSNPEPDVKEEYDYSQDGGKLFQHIHQVIVKPRFGDAIISRARFIIWPFRVITLHPGNTFADFLVHVTDASGNEQIFCTDGKVKQLKMTVDGKQYCVYGIWNNSAFESHVVLDDKSASMFRMEEDVQKQEPEGNYGDEFLDQFRYDHKGQPFHFIVPFLNSNRGELNIPIVGFVSIDGKKYPLERCEGNTLRYRTRTKTEKVIRGHWEKNSFVFHIDDATKLLWEEN